MGLDTSFYEEEQKHFGESQARARGKLRVCPRLGIIAGTIQGGQDWANDGDGVRVKSRPATFCVWPVRSDLDPINSNNYLRPRGYWQFDITVRVFGDFNPSPTGLTGFPILLSRFDATTTSGEPVPGSPGYDRAYDESGRTLYYAEQIQTMRESNGAFALENRRAWLHGEDGWNPPVNSLSAWVRPSFIIPATPGTTVKQLILRDSPEGFCHPGFGLGNISLELGSLFRGPDGNHYVNRFIEFDGTLHWLWMNQPAIPSGGTPVPIWDISIIVRRKYDWTPSISYNQTRFGTVGVDGGIFRIAYAEVGYNDGNGKTHWSWNFDGTIVTPLPNQTRDYATIGAKNVAVTVTDGNGFLNTGSRVIYPKRVDWTYTNPGGDVRVFSSALVNAGDAAVSTYLWTFEWSTLSGTFTDTSTAANPTYNFPASFDKAAKLRVVFTDGQFYETPLRDVTF